MTRAITKNLPQDHFASTPIERMGSNSMMDSASSRTQSARTRMTAGIESYHDQVILKSMSYDDGSAQGYSSSRPSNEYVLNVAFFSFLGFTAVQAIFAFIAHSEAMLTDSAAMAVDALTYLFNLVAERIKHTPYSSQQRQGLLSIKERRYKRKLKQLYLELVPPLISVSTLIFVTVVALDQAFETLVSDAVVKHDDNDVGVPKEQANDDEPSLNIMLLFSAFNLILDIVNVMYFASVNQAVGLNTVIHQHLNIGSLHQHHQQHNHDLNEKAHLMSEASQGRGVEVQVPQIEEMSELDSNNDNDDDEDEEDEDESGGGMNLNMCSAWTHVCADTMRSIAVLVAAGFATIFSNVIEPAEADAVAAVIVSVIIIISLFPLIRGLYLTAVEIYHLTRAEQNSKPPVIALTV